MIALGSVVLLIGWSGGAFGQEDPPLPVKKLDLYLSGHGIGLFPQGKDHSVGGNRISNTDVRGRNVHVEILRNRLLGQAPSARIIGTDQLGRGILSLRL